MLNRLFPQTLKLDSKTLAEEKDAKIDIYNYAARFDLVPKFEFRFLEPLIHNQGLKKVVEVTIELAEQSIRVIGNGLNPAAAEISAALKFKEQAEMYHAQGEKGPIVIRDSEALTTDNCKSFFKFYNVVHPRARVSVDCDRVRLTSGDTYFKSQVKIDGAPVGEPVEMQSIKGAENLAFLTAAVALKKDQPDLYPRFLEALKTGNGSILAPVSPSNLPVGADTVLLMQDTLLRASKLGLRDSLLHETEHPIIDEAVLGTRGPARYLHRMSPKASQQRDSHMQDAHRIYLQDFRFHELRSKRSELPMNQYRTKVLDLINNNPYSIIVGATGSGKTTQVPQMLLEEAIIKGSGSACNIICTQPRRIAATSVARRVAQERGESLQDTVGYQVRFDTRLPSSRGSISFCTTGILLRQLQTAPDDVMDNISHLIIDEVHERALEVDFLLVSLRKIVKERTTKALPSPKIVLMSATIDTDLFAAYFSNGKGTADCPSITVPGRTFPVREKHLDSILSELKQSYPASSLRLLQDDDPTSSYLKINDEFLGNQSVLGRASANPAPRNEESIIDWKKEQKLSAEGQLITGNEKDDALVPNALVATTIAHIAKTSDEGAILAFLPGIDEIVRVEKWLTDTHLLGVDFKDASKFKIYLLHSSIAAGQTEVFETVPLGCRKIILATNIAETSITIPDVRYVVDTGKVREKQYDQTRRITSLTCTWISKSNSKQRAGRAGRVQNGNYYALFPKECYDSMRASPLAEMLRADLQETCLSIKSQAFTTPIRDFLADAIEPPPPKAVDASVISLKALDALTSDEKLTPLGRLLATLPVHPSLGKMIVLGVIFRCLDPMLILGAAASERSIFVQPPGLRLDAQGTKSLFAESSGSDHIAILNAVRKMRYHRHKYGDRDLFSFAMQNFIHMGAFKSVTSTAQQIQDVLVDAGLIPFTAPSELKDLQFGHPSLNHNSANIPLIKALTLAGVYPNLAVSTSARLFRTASENRVMIHMSSVNSPHHKDNDTPFGALYSYSSLVRAADGSSMMMRDTTQSTPLMAILFGGKIDNTASNALQMDGWLPWWVRSTDRNIGNSNMIKMILIFRQTLERVMSRAFQDLSNIKASQGKAPQGNERPFLATELIRSIFADAVVKLLDLDLQSNISQSQSQAQDTVTSRGSSGKGSRPRGDGYDRDTEYSREAGYGRETGFKHENEHSAHWAGGYF